MLPSLASYNLSYITLACAELLGNRTLKPALFIEFSHLFNIINRIFGALISRVGSFSRTPFLFHIGHIRLMCSKKKMVGTHAASVIAMMANIQTFWEFTEMDFIRKTMNANRTRTIAAFRNKTVAASGVVITSPIPATAGFLDFCPESFYQRTWLNTLWNTFQISFFVCFYAVFTVRVITVFYYFVPKKLFDAFNLFTSKTLFFWRKFLWRNYFYE